MDDYVSLDLESLEQSPYVEKPRAEVVEEAEEEGLEKTCYRPLKEDVYHNMSMIAPDGRVLCRCGPKKVQWYLSRGLAKVLSEEPLVIQLNFEPGGNGESDDAYQLADKDNHCVVCGRDDYNTKHHIVEYEYRQHMPLEYKSHNSYDLMILCGPCHTRYEIEAAKLKAELATKYNAPVNGKGWFFDTTIGKLKKSVKALEVAGDKMPAARVAEIQKLIREYLGKNDTDPILPEELQRISQLEPVTRTEQYQTHGEAVVSCLSTQELLTEFIQMWRKHFIDTMQPQFLHPQWGVERGKSELRPMSKKGRMVDT